MYRVSIELYKHEWKFGRTRNSVGTRAAGECFHSSQSYVFVYTSWFYLDSLDVDLYGDLLAVDLNQEMTYPEVKTKGWFCMLNLLLA